MATKTVKQSMQQKRAILANWTTKNPVIKADEIGFITDNKMFKNEQYYDLVVCFTEKSVY